MGVLRRAHWLLPIFLSKVRNLYLDTHDGAKIGAWLVLAEGAYGQAMREGRLSTEGQFEDSVFDAALRSSDYPTVLYFHGNAGTRAVGNRVRVGQKISAMNCNFLITDYRGFADSSSKPPPSEEGVLIDARRAFDYLHLEKQVDASRIVIMGQSLGTGIGTALAARLEAEGKKVKGLILVAPFSSIATLLETYKLGNVIPLVSPLTRFPWLFKRLLSLLRTKLDTKSIISDVSAPILLVHAQDDPVIPFSHSRTLSDHLLEPLLLGDNKDELVKEQRIGRWGTVKRFERGSGKGRVVWAEAKEGSHTFIGETEYVMRLIKEVIFDDP
ncbi:alpha/beta hydrolase [Sporobolomyces salmoneus]|uniref:alpha/beta hydrolase n=1 Tax=Sporobolomyces salmoneus TaxID=183962 RepID=UPI00316FFD68